MCLKPLSLTTLGYVLTLVVTLEAAFVSTHGRFRGADMKSNSSSKDSLPATQLRNQNHHSRLNFLFGWCSILPVSG